MKFKKYYKFKLFVVLVVLIKNQPLLSFYGPNWVIPCQNSCVDDEYGFYFCKNNNGKISRELGCSKNPNNEVNKLHMKHDMGYSIDSWSTKYTRSTLTMLKNPNGTDTYRPIALIKFN